jgi:hypothetical protein
MVMLNSSITIPLAAFRNSIDAISGEGFRITKDSSWYS